jgi:hypothetical protein
LLDILKIHAAKVYTKFFPTVKEKAAFYELAAGIHEGGGFIQEEDSLFLDLGGLSVEFRFGI